MLVLSAQGAKEEVRICGASECEDWDRVPFEHEGLWLFHLHRLKRDDISMNAARQLLAKSHYPVYRLDNAEVLKQIAARVRYGTLRVCAKTTVEPIATPAGARTAPKPPPFPLAQRQGRVRIAPPVEPPMFGPSLEGEAQAEVLKEAAKTGVPFCEECARAAAARRN